MWQSICWWLQSLQYLWRLLGVQDFGVYGLDLTLFMFGKVKVAMSRVVLKLAV